MERRLIATIPATTPGPIIDTRRRAQISELMDREETIISSAIGRINLVLGVVFRAAKKATGKAIIIASIVPTSNNINSTKLSFKSIEIFNHRSGKPGVNLKNDLAVDISISHDGNYAIAFCVVQ